MSLHEQSPFHQPKLLSQRTGKSSDYEQLNASLAYRSRHRRHDILLPEEMGTAEHRPKRGLIYDAPLGLKF